MVGFEKALGAVKVIKDQIQYRSQSLLNLARDYFRQAFRFFGMRAVLDALGYRLQAAKSVMRGIRLSLRLFCGAVY